jgi:hypothetical protein
MKLVLMAVLVLGSFAAQAEEIVERTIETGNEKIVAVGSCGMSSHDSQLNVTRTQFPYTVCVETKTFKARKIKNEGKMWNKTSYEPIAGTEKLSYNIKMKENGDTRTNPDGDILITLESAASCRALRNTLANSVVELKNTGCGN